jgi:hypothetical protein
VLAGYLCAKEDVWGSAGAGGVCELSEEEQYVGVVLREGMDGGVGDGIGYPYR